jgi:predicted nucleic acid-binding Zn ribbon protein
LAQQQPNQNLARHGYPQAARESQLSVTPVEYECGVCEQPIEGVVYFASSYYHRPICGACARLAKRRKLVDWYATFRPDEEPPAQDADVPALKLPSSEECEVCGRKIAWLVWRQSRLVVCSYRCRSERENAKRRVGPYEPRACAVCGEPFTPKRSDAKTCSDRCRQKLRRARLSQIPTCTRALADSRDNSGSTREKN